MNKNRAFFFKKNFFFEQHIKSLKERHYDFAACAAYVHTLLSPASLPADAAGSPRRPFVIRAVPFSNANPPTHLLHGCATLAQPSCVSSRPLLLSLAFSTYLDTIARYIGASPHTIRDSSIHAFKVLFHHRHVRPISRLNRRKTGAQRHSFNQLS